ncbi:MAG: energy transducer TonB [Ignavibacteria bacterium]|nr:energy transducer TonB [Ignavibacteria bacterium]
MSSEKSTGISYTVSIFLHAILIGLFLFINMSFDYSPADYIELSFGISSESGSSGAEGNLVENIEEISELEMQSTTEEQNREVNEVDLPVSENTSEENIIIPADEEKEITEENKNENTEEVNSNVTSTGEGNESVGDGSLGFDIDWGGNGTRKIYSFLLPQYPEGVKKEIDIKLEFTILADGTVGTIIPKMKADTRLENAAINSLRQWRFEALRNNQRQAEQKAIIVFPYRLQ